MLTRLVDHHQTGSVPVPSGIHPSAILIKETFGQTKNVRLVPQYVFAPSLMPVKVCRKQTMSMKVKPFRIGAPYSIQTIIMR